MSITMHKNEPIHIIIIRLFSGEANIDEKKHIKNWLNHSSENRKLYADLKEIWLSAGSIDNTDQYDLEKAIIQFKDKIDQEKKASFRRIKIFNVLKYAAIALLVLALPLSYIMGEKNSVLQDTYTTISCAMGDKTNIILPDSSFVFLNSGSRITFNNNFKKGKRHVFLEGEAYFSVTKDKENPFHIKTSEIEVEVLGTEFNLKAYPNEKTISTTLIEGSLRIYSSKQRTIIEPNQKLIYNTKTKRMALIELTDTSSEIDWKDGRLVFRNESLGELELKLERWFDVDIVLADEAVKTRKFTGTLEGESILDVLSYFSLAQSMDYKRQGNNITFFTTNKN